MKNNISKFALLGMVSLFISACGDRNSPDEFGIVKYNALVIPSERILLVPDENARPLGYKTSREIVSQLQNDNLQNSNSQNGDSILQAFNIPDVNDSIKQELLKPRGDTIVVNIKKEIERIDTNLSSGAKITDGETPSVNVKNTRSGIDELFSD